MWSAESGLPSVEYFEACYPGFSAPAAKLGSSFAPLGTLAGTLRPELAGKLGCHHVVLNATEEGEPVYRRDATHGPRHFRASAIRMICLIPITNRSSP